MAGLPAIELTGAPPVEVFKDLQWVMTGFNRLSPRRPQGMNGPTRIPVSEIESYCRLMDFDHPRRVDFLYYIERMDEVYMEFVRKQIAEEEKKQELARAKAAKKTNPGRR